MKRETAVIIQKLGPEYDMPIKRMRLIAGRSVGQYVDAIVDPSLVLADTRYARTFLNPENPCYHCYGLVDAASGALYSVIAVKQEPVRGRWLLQWLCADARLDNGRALNGVFDLVDHVLRLNEAEGMSCWVGAIPAKYQKVYDRLWRKHCPAYCAYRVTQTVRVPANAVPDSSEHFNELFFFVVQPIDMLVRTHVKHLIEG
jgi:hypothetical protein